MTSRSKKITVFSLIFLAAALLVCGAVYAVASFGSVAPSRVIPTLTPEHYRMEYENFSLSFSGQTLSGWLIPAQDGLSDKTVIFSHDRASSREIPEADGFFLMRELSQNGYNVMTFDYLGSGSSGGDFYTFGISESRQLSAVVSYAAEQIPGTKIALIGWGCGAAAAVKAAESDEVLGVVAESCYEQFDETVFSRYFSLPFPSAGMALAQTVSGTAFSLSPVETLRGISGKNFYFIHCLDDIVIPYTASQNLNLAAAQNNVSELWLIEEGGHCLGALASEANYSSRILLFLSRFL